MCNHGKASRGNSIHKIIDEQIVYDQPGQDESVIWSLLVASGYLKLETISYFDSRSQPSQAEP